MIYRIEYQGGCNYARNRKDLLEWLELLRGETITDIRKEYKNGSSETVKAKYEKYITRRGGKVA